MKAWKSHKEFLTSFEVLKIFAGRFVKSSKRILKMSLVES